MIVLLLFKCKVAVSASVASFVFFFFFPSQHLLLQQRFRDSSDRGTNLHQYQKEAQNNFPLKNLQLVFFHTFCI